MTKDAGESGFSLDFIDQLGSGSGGGIQQQPGVINKSLFDDASQINKASSPTPDIDFLNDFLPDPLNS